MKPGVLRPQAEIDLIDMTQWYAEQGGLPLAERFFDSDREAIKTIERTPGIGVAAPWATRGYGWPSVLAGE